MISADEAIQRILQSVSPLCRTEELPVAEAGGRILAEEITAGVDLPPFDNSAMDGFAVSMQDVVGASAERPARLSIQETIAAGTQAAGTVVPGVAIRIMTGAPVPQGADAVVMKELTRATNGTVEIFHEPQPREHIRRRGEDVTRGANLLRQGCLLRPLEIALLAAQGVAKIRVMARPRVAILTTGDELVSAGGPLVKGSQIYDSNGPAIVSTLTRWGVPVRDFGIVPDNRSTLEETLRRAMEESDMLLVSGGVSVGDFDLTKPLLETLGMTVVFWKVAIKPGKPLLFGLCQGKPVFGLPGNPVSALVCLEEFVRPAIERLEGFHPSYPSYHVEGILDADLWKEEGRQQYLFSQVSEATGGFQVHVIRPQGSAMVGMACQANALIKVPLEVRHLPKGSTVRFRWLK